MKRTIFSLIIAMLIVTVGCDFSKLIPKETSKETSKEATGRKETKDIEAVGIVGYDGAAIRKDVEEVLDKAKERQKEVDKIMGK